MRQRETLGGGGFSRDARRQNLDFRRPSNIVEQRKVEPVAQRVASQRARPEGVLGPVLARALT